MYIEPIQLLHVEVVKFQAEHGQVRAMVDTGLYPKSTGPNESVHVREQVRVTIDADGHTAS
jgi:hypothetical protein